MAFVVILLMLCWWLLGTLLMFAIAGDVHSFGHGLQEVHKPGQGHCAELDPVFCRNCTIMPS
jgi:hypothetical protein